MVYTNHNFCIETMSTDWTSSSQARILSKMSSVGTLSSSMTHPSWSFWMPKATSNLLGWLFQVKPSIQRAKILWANSSRLVVQASQIFTSKTTMDLAAGLAFLAFSFGFSTGLGLAAGVSSSAKGSKSSSSFLVSAFFSSFLPWAACCCPAKDWSLEKLQVLMKRYQQ